MKKAVALILIALPIVLMVSISLAGSLLGVFGTIKVEHIVFVNENGEEIEYLDLGLDQEYQIEVVIKPEKASDKTVRFHCESDVIDITEEGLVTTLKYGEAKVTAVSADERVSAQLTIKISDKVVTGVSLNIENLTIKHGEEKGLKETVSPSTAENKMVTWTSSDPERVGVTPSGKITAYNVTEPGEPVVITVETEDGGFKAECLVTVIPPDFFFAKPGGSVPVMPDEDIIVRTATIDLFDYIKNLTGLFETEDITFYVESGSSFAELDENGILTFKQSGGTVKIRAEADGGEIYSAKAGFRYSA